MSRYTRKPIICICVNKGTDQFRSEADQRLCFLYTDITIPLLLISKISSVRPGRNPKLLVFSCKSSYYFAHQCIISLLVGVQVRIKFRCKIEPVAGVITIISCSRDGNGVDVNVAVYRIPVKMVPYINLEN